MLALDLLYLPNTDRLIIELRETMRALQYQDRPPTLEDAWRFLFAAKTLDRVQAFDTTVIAAARRIGLHLACSAAALLVADVHRIDAGSSTEYVAIPQADGLQ